MTTRVKPVVKRPSRSGWEGGDRRSLLINVGFAATIVVSILILIGYGAWSWWDDHYGTAASVNGVVITRDDLRARVRAETFRIDYTSNRIRTLRTEGKLTGAEAESQLSNLEQRRQSVDAIALERLIDIELQRQLADEAGIVITDAEVDARFTEEQMIAEERHGWVIEVKPENDPATGTPGDAQRAAARAKADAALAELRGGAAWDDIAKATSTATSAPQAGDLGWLNDGAPLDAPFVEALFAAAVDTPTDVIEGEDGTFRIGRTSEITPGHLDETYLTGLEEAGVTPEAYRAVVRGDLLRDRLTDTVVADLSKPGPQRHVLQIYIAELTQPVPDGVKVRHILVSPNDDPQAAGTLAADDPAWKTAEDEAQAIYAEVVKDPGQFDRLAREKTDEGAGSTTGGKLPYYDRTSPIDNAFADAIFQEGLTNGQILPPFKSAFGWHIVQFLHPYGNGDLAWMDQLRAEAAKGADFAALARDNGEGEEAGNGGDIGWVARGTLGELQEMPIFTTPVGEVSPVTEVPGEGIYLWKVLAEETRTPTADQIEIFRSSGFDNWYAQKKAAATIDRPYGSSALGG